MARKGKSRGPTGDEWEKQRPNIIRLFQDEDMTLDQVRERMRSQYNFSAE